MNAFSDRTSRLEVVRAFLKLGGMSYGGPAIMGIMRAEIQERRAWVSRERFVEGLGEIDDQGLEATRDRGGGRLAGRSDRLRHRPGPAPGGGDRGHALRWETTGAGGHVTGRAPHRPLPPERRVARGLVVVRHRVSAGDGAGRSEPVSGGLFFFKVGAWSTSCGG